MYWTYLAALTSVSRLCAAYRALLLLDHALVAPLVSAACVHKSPLLPLVKRQPAARAHVAQRRLVHSRGRRRGGHEAANGAQIWGKGRKWRGLIWYHFCRLTKHNILYCGIEIFKRHLQMPSDLNEVWVKCTSNAHIIRDIVALNLIFPSLYDFWHPKTFSILPKLWNFHPSSLPVIFYAVP